MSMYIYYTYDSTQYICNYTLLQICMLQIQVLKKDHLSSAQQTGELSPRVWVSPLVDVNHTTVVLGWAAALIDLTTFDQFLGASRHTQKMKLPAKQISISSIMLYSCIGQNMSQALLAMIKCVSDLIRSDSDCRGGIFDSSRKSCGGP